VGDFGHFFQDSKEFATLEEEFGQLTHSDWFSPLQEYSRELIEALFSPVTTVRTFTKNGKRIVEARGIKVSLARDGFNRKPPGNNLYYSFNRTSKI
jgi:hypothetical protein